jgi:hypothetical protein
LINGGKRLPGRLAQHLLPCPCLSKALFSRSGELFGMITAYLMKDPTDPSFKNDAGMNEWHDFMAKYIPGADTTDVGHVFAYGVSKAMLQVLKQCEGNFTRENIMKQAANLHDPELPTLLPGIKVNTSPTNYHPIRQMQLAKIRRYLLGLLRRRDRRRR